MVLPNFMYDWRNYEITIIVLLERDLCISVINGSRGSLSSIKLRLIASLLIPLLRLILTHLVLQQTT